LVETSYVAVFLIGLFGGVHCAGMCGGIVAALGLAASRRGGAVVPVAPVAPVAAPATVARVPIASIGVAGNAVMTPGTTGTATFANATARLSGRVLAFNLARVSTYTALGAVAGTLGSLGLVMERMLPVQQAALVVANLMLLAMGLYVAGYRRLVVAVESLGAPLWRRVRPVAARALGGGGTRGLMLGGALWGLVPCGMVYTVLIAALTTGRALDGALLMAAFGLGTLPNLVLMGTSAAWLARVRRHAGLRRALGAALIGFALVGLLRIDTVLGMPLLGELCFRPR